MSKHRRPAPGHPPGRARASLMRVPDLLQAVQAAAMCRRVKVAGRFRGPYDWRRLFALGVILVDLAILAIVFSDGRGKIIDYWPGMSSIFGGLLLAIIIIRLGQPQLYLDWIANGLLHVGLGLVIAKDPMLAATSSFIIFCGLLITTAALTTWIGMTLNLAGGRSWMMAGGLTSLLNVVVPIVSRSTVLIVKPDIVLAVNLFLLGVSIAGYGLSIKNTSVE
ncbi:hypothetical protein ACSV5K_23795 [Agrobacterium pusense]|uniref:hypothetical protein n=1 Tax=Agrobacterium pusense TaxID=648995 RepID=UPI003FD188D9